MMTDETKPVRACSASPAEAHGLPPLDDYLPKSGRWTTAIAIKAMQDYARAAIATSQQQAEGAPTGEPDAYRYEYATRIDEYSGYDGWMPGISLTDPARNMPPNAFRNVVQLYAATPSPAKPQPKGTEQQAQQEAEDEEELQRKRSANQWDHVRDFIPVFNAAMANKWHWYANTDCKYVELRIDMRDGGCIIKDRNGGRITPAMLARQYGGESVDLSVVQAPAPGDEGQQDWDGFGAGYKAGSEAAQQAVWEAINKTQARYLGVIQTAVNLLAAVDDRHASAEQPLKYMIPYGAVNALRAALEAQPEAQAPAVAHAPTAATLTITVNGSTTTIDCEWGDAVHGLPPGVYPLHFSNVPVQGSGE